MKEDCKPLFIRRAEAREILGVSDEVFTGLIAAGSLRPMYFPRPSRRCKSKGNVKGRAFFKRAEVERLANSEQQQ